MSHYKISTLDYLFPPLHPEGPGFVALFGFCSLILWFLWSPLGIIGLLLTVWCFYFFRDPVRITSVGHGLFASPADGIVQSIMECKGPIELEMHTENFVKISIFMSVFDCHVNRVPMAGEVVQDVYVPGLFVNASLDKASTDNERQCLKIQTDDGQDYAVVQIAGLVARRIRCDVKPGDSVIMGQRFGMIRFGSRVDVYMPLGTVPVVFLGQKMVAGETVIADTSVEDGTRFGEVR